MRRSRFLSDAMDGVFEAYLKPPGVATCRCIVLFDTIGGVWGLILVSPENETPPEKVSDSGERIWPSIRRLEGRFPLMMDPASMVLLACSRMGDTSG